MARSGRTVVISIHQPRSEIAELFDRLIVLAKGNVIFDGTFAAVASAFEVRGVEPEEGGAPVFATEAALLTMIVARFPAPQLKEGDVASQLSDRLVKLEGDSLRRMVAQHRRVTPREDSALAGASAVPSTEAASLLFTAPKSRGHVNQVRTLAHLLHRAFDCDTGLATRTVVLYVCCAAFGAGTFFNFQVDNAIDAFVFTTLIGVTLVLVRFVSVEKHTILIQREGPALDAELRSKLYSPLVYMLSLCGREALFLFVAFLAGYPLSTFPVNLLASGDALLRCGIVVMIFNFTSVALVTAIFQLTASYPLAIGKRGGGGVPAGGVASVGCRPLVLSSLVAV